MKPDTLLKILIKAGKGPRRQLADAIISGQVTVNGAVIDNLKHPVNPESDRIKINGKPVTITERQHVYLLVNKPAGILSAVKDSRGRKTVMDIIPPHYQRYQLYPVGRLDKESTGLILLTNDGSLTYRLTHPRFEHEKEYYVNIGGKLSPSDIKKLEKGIHLEDGLTYPAAIRKINISPFRYSIIIHEGRKRQVRRMFAALGHPVRALKRVRMGSLKLGNLKEGEVRELGEEERISLA